MDRVCRVHRSETWDKFIDIDRAFALNRNGFELLGCEFDVLAFCDLVAFYDVRLLDIVACLSVHLAVTYAIASLFVELIEADFLPLGCRRVEGDGTRDERQLEIAFPIRTRGHSTLLHTGQPNL